MSLPHTIADALLVAGGLNLGTVALTDGRVNPIEDLTRNNQVMRNVVYGAIGASALYVLADNLTNGFGQRGQRQLGSTKHR